MGKYQTRASKGGEIASGKASSVYMAREEGYSRGFQDGKKAYNEFIRFSFSNDIKLIEGEKKNTSTNIIAVTVHMTMKTMMRLLTIIILKSILLNT